MRFMIILTQQKRLFMAYFDRQKGAPWYKYYKELNIVIVGAGTIGSWTALSVARAIAGIHNISLTLFDKDKVEKHNLTGQMFTTVDEGHPKVKVLRRFINKLTPNVSIFEKEEFLNEDTVSLLPKGNKIIILATDSMESRDTIYSLIEKNKIEDVSLIIDGRLSPQVMEVITSTPKDIKEIRENYIYSKEELIEDTCSFKSTTYTGLSIAGQITANVVNYLSNVVENIEIFTVPKYVNLSFTLNKTSYESL